jgi:prevent-host-death family protein
MPAFNLYEAKTGLSQLVERAAKGEEVIIAKAGKPMVKMVPMEPEEKPKRRISGQNLMGITYISPDFGKPIWTDEELEELGLA